jgi:glutamate-1-semialdehyde aminotransferase
MLPSDDAEWVAAELSRRFGPSQWSFALSATDAIRWALTLARLVTGRPVVLVFSYCSCGSIDESDTLSAGPGGCAAAWGLEPDMVTLGKAVAGGIPIGAFGMRADLADRILGQIDGKHSDPHLTWASAAGR